MKLSLGAAAGAGQSSISKSGGGIAFSKKLPENGGANGGKKSNKAFMGDDDDGDAAGNNGRDEPIASTSSLKASSSSKKRIDPTRPSASANPSRILKKLHAAAEAEDPSIFAYDEVYDSMKAGAAAADAARKAAKESEGDKPKYVNQLLAAAELRKKDRIRAEDKLIEREREKEGDEFKDKDAFVTSAYKEQQAELRRAEEEEKRKEGMS